MLEIPLATGNNLHKIIKQENFFLVGPAMKYGPQKILSSSMLQRNIYSCRKQFRPHKVTSKSACPLPLLLFVKKQTGRDPIVAICWLWTTHSLLFTQLPANMCISISHFFLELISELNHNHMKDDFSKTAAFQNLVCISNGACLFWSHCFYWTLSELLQKNTPPSLLFL